MSNLKNVKQVKELVWGTLRSPKILAFLKLAGAVVGVVHAIDELTSTPKTARGPVGFKMPQKIDEPEDGENLFVDDDDDLS